MPFKSEAQRRKFHELYKQGKISKKVLNEFEEASKGKKLPERKGEKKDPLAYIYDPKKGK